jgi:hypothetical protein
LPVAVVVATQLVEAAVLAVIEHPLEHLVVGLLPNLNLV